MERPLSQPKSDREVCLGAESTRRSSKIIDLGLVHAPHLGPFVMNWETLSRANGESTGRSGSPDSLLLV